MIIGLNITYQADESVVGFDLVTRTSYPSSSKTTLDKKCLMSVQ